MQQIAQDEYLIKNACRVLLRWDAMSCNRADTIDARIRVLEDQVQDVEVQVWGIEDDLQDSRDIVVDLELCIEGHKAKLVEEYTASLEGSSRGRPSRRST